MDRPPNNNDPRKATAIKSITTGETPVDFWADFDFAGTATGWDDRAVQAAKHIMPGSHVIDYGCANMRLEGVLPPGCTYLPVDLAARDHRTTVADLNKEVPGLQADVVTGLGLLEYILDIPRFLREVATRANRGIFSYHPLERSAKRDRLAMAWVNALNTTELHALLAWAGYRKIRVIELGKKGASQILFVGDSARCRFSQPTP